MWHESGNEVHKLLYDQVKAIRPQADIGRHVDHRQSSWDLFYRAGSRYQEMPEHVDFIKPILYHDILGPRLQANYLEPLQQGLLKELTLPQSLSLFYAWFGHSQKTEPNLAKLAEGLSPEYVYRETKRAVDGAAGRAAVYSGIGLDIPKGGGWGTDVWQSDPDEVYRVVRKAFDAGAAGIVVSREYEEITTPSLRVVGRAVRDHQRKLANTDLEQGRLLMANQLENVTETLLMGPGPSCVPPEVYRALARPTIGHLDPRFIALMEEIKDLLRTVMGTQNGLTLPISGTGSAGMETCFVNLIERGDRVLVLVNGVFGVRMADVASRLGASVDTVEFEWGTPVEVEAVKQKLADGPYSIVAIVHAETSTGVCNPVAEVGKLVSETGALYLVDTVTSLGGMPVMMDDWNCDVLYSGTQKCLSCPPGLAPVSFSDRAVAKLRARETKVPNWYLDLTLITSYWEGAKRSYHHTAPINMLYALYQALLCVVEEGLEAVHGRHRAAHQQLVDGLESLGMEMLVAQDSRLPMLNAVKVPEGIDEAAVRTALLTEHDIEIGAGLGPLAGKVWRIGVMGHTARPENVRRFLGALEAVLQTQPTAT